MENKTLEKQIRPSVFELTPYVPAKPVEEMREELGLSRIVKLDANENALGTSPLALKAMESQMGSLNRYPDGYFQGLRRALAKHWHVDEEQVIAGNGSDEVLSLIAQTFLGEGDEMIVVDPTFSSYEFYATIMGARVIHLSLEPDTYGLSVDGLLGAVTDRCKIVCVCTPNNPTGGVLTEPVLKELAELAAANDLMVISDEVYERLIYDGERHISIASLPGMKERTFTLNGMSKAYAMDGWRLGYVAAPEEYINAMNKFHQYNTTCAPNFVQLAAAAALNEENGEVDAMVREYRRRRDYAVKAINEIPGISCLCPKGAFYIFINVKQLGKTSEELAQYLLEKAKIALVPGNVFGPGGEGYLRMSFAASYEDIVEGCQKLKQAITGKEI